MQRGMQHRALVLSDGRSIPTGGKRGSAGWRKPIPWLLEDRMATAADHWPAHLEPAQAMITGADPSAASVNVTVGIPTYNRARLLERSIASVLRQTYRHFSLVVSDNASDDDTAAVVASFRDPRLVYRPASAQHRSGREHQQADRARRDRVHGAARRRRPASPRASFTHGRRAQALADRGGGAHRVRDRRRRRQRVGRTPSPDRYPATSSSSNPGRSFSNGA